MRIDVHAHYWTADYLDVLVALGKTDTGTQRGLGAGGGAALAARLRLMDRAGVDMQVLSAAPQLPYSDNRDQAIAAARFVNDQYAALVDRYADRFRAFAATPLPHIAASLAELARALDELGMVGVTMTTTVLGQPLVEPAPAQRAGGRPPSAGGAGIGDIPMSSARCRATPSRRSTPCSSRRPAHRAPRARRLRCRLGPATLT